VLDSCRSHDTERAWPFGPAFMLLGFPFVVVMPALAALMVAALRASGYLSRHKRLGARLLASSAELLVPVSGYFGLAVVQH
jgi:hypothetical protein